MDKFVVGFAFSKSKDSVLLVQKLRPEWQKGLLNGIGGKIEGEEAPITAMNRECVEETTLLLDWECKGFMYGVNNDGRYFECHIFYSYSKNLLDFKQIEDELLGVYNPLYLNPTQIVPDLSFLIPFGVCDDGALYTTLQY